MPRYAGTCSYGYGGSISHTIVEEYKVPMSEDKTGDPPRPQVLLLSAPLEKGLARQADTLASWMNDSGKRHEPAAIATTLATRRGHRRPGSRFPHADSSQTPPPLAGEVALVTAVASVRALRWAGEYQASRIQLEFADS
ncbi:polyketide synthase [Penicillium alfredii]|uniref:Polyketide synthase n=1 Tax=Penicillium alfredii TaxID=1506179 RepID=A0A9W9FQC8_9EURO|nr:polyketide synthase [Penicillium alfredii]KAJ5104359.1 polyketide synthase [Penicillium alfredii]